MRVGVMNVVKGKPQEEKKEHLTGSGREKNNNINNNNNFPGRGKAHTQGRPGSGRKPIE